MSPKKLFDPPPICCDFIKRVACSGGIALFVGGCVRDFLLGRASEDFDLEVFGLDPEVLASLIQEHFGEVKSWGRPFGIFKLKNYPFIEIGLPRREQKTGPHHRDFTIELIPFADYKTAAQRRDFTINSLGFNLLTDTLLDPFQGKEDLKKCILQHITNHFSEDPLRVLRGMQLAGRFSLHLSPETQLLCQALSPETLSRERIFDEFQKLFSKDAHPSIGFQYLASIDWLRYFKPFHQCFVRFPDQWQIILQELDDLAVSAEASNVTHKICAYLYHSLEKFDIPCQAFFETWIPNAKQRHKILQMASTNFQD